MHDKLKSLLLQVIDGEVGEVDLPFVPIEQIEEVLKELGVDIEICDRDTNGWQVDFWNEYDDRYLLWGSVHYGNFKFKTI